MKKPSRISVIAPAEPAEFFDLLWEGVWSATFELSSFGVSVETIQTQGHDFTAQSQRLEELLDDHRDAPRDAIVLIPAHASALNPLIARHVAQGTPVITFNADAPESARCSFVGPDARKAGTLAAEVLAKMMCGAGQVITFPGLLETQHLRDRYSGFLEELQRWSPQMTEAACHPGFDDFEQAATDLLAAYPQVRGIYVGNSRVHQVAAALEKAGLRIPCVGFNNTEAVRPFLKNGWVSAVIDESTYQQGYLAVQRAYEAMLSPQDTPSRWVSIPSSVVFAANTADTLSGDSLNEAFELLIRQRTNKLQSYQELLKDANSELLRLAETDALTGLLNRRKFEEILNEQALRSARRGSLALLMIDLDAFKSCNDTFGHHVGDEALKAVARILQTSSRSTDFCARLGGDEFCILMPDANRRAAEEVRERIQHSAAQTVIAPQTLNLRIHLSVGAATLPEDARTAEDLIVAADQAMYAEKRRVRQPHGFRESDERVVPIVGRA